MIVTSDSTALIAIRTDAKTGRPTRIKPFAANERGASPRPTTRPTTTNTNTGMPIVPNAPSGSRRKIFISIQVSVQRPRSILVSLVANRVTGQFEKNVFEVGEHGAKVGDLYSVLG